MTEEEREALWSDLGRPLDLVEMLRHRAAELERTHVAGPSTVLLLRDAADELAGLNVAQWEYLVQRRMARADVHGGES